MRILFLFCFLFFVQDCFCQFNPAKEWFTVEDFFDTIAVKRLKISQITVARQKKYDNAIFNKKTDLAQYSFCLNGKLALSEVYTPLSRRVDTLSVRYYYNLNKVKERREQQGPFDFSFYKNWRNDSLFQLIKVDRVTGDTNLKQNVSSVFVDNQLKVITFSSIGRPMKTERYQNNSFGKEILYRLNYNRSLSFFERQYNYSARQLLSRKEVNTIGKHWEKEWVYNYVNGYLDAVELRKNNKLIEKLGILYDQNQLIKTVVKRNYVEKSVTIYSVAYRFYSD